MRAGWAVLALVAAAPVLADPVIRGRVVDADTGEPIACTVVIRDASGNVVEDHPSFRGGFRCPGEFAKSVQGGRVTITVSRGFDYGSETRAVDLGEGTTLEFRLKRRTPLRRLGWYASDSHVHMIHGERKIVVDFPYVALAGRAEALDFLSVCQQWNLPRVTPEELDRACRRVSTPDFQLAWNMEAPKNYWRGDSGRCVGHGWTLGMRGRTSDGRDAISELLSISAWDYEVDKPSTPNFEIQAFIHSLEGIVSYTHPHRWWYGEWGGKAGYPLETHKVISNMAAELPFDTVAGPTYDTIDIMMQPEEQETNRRALELWWLLLNHGYRIPATASSDTTFDNPGGGVPGRVRVYTHIEGKPTIASLASAMKSGRNFVTSGPLVLFEIGGHRPGDVVRLGTHSAALEARVSTWASGAPGERLTKVELIRNGAVVKSWDPDPGSQEFRATTPVSESTSAWYIVRCYGSTAHQIAITNPVYFEDAEYRAPVRAHAAVSGEVRDSATGAPLAGTIEVIAMDGRIPVVTSVVRFKGSFRVTVEPTARLRARVDGYAPEMKSVFMDSPELLNIMLNMNAERLSDWSTFQRIRALLRNVPMDFNLTRR